MEKELEKQKGQVTHVENKLKELKKAKPNSHKLVTLEKEKKELEERSENQKRTIELHIKTIKRYDGEAKSRESDYTKLENNNIKIKKELEDKKGIIKRQMQTQEERRQEIQQLNGELENAKKEIQKLKGEPAESGDIGTIARLESTLKTVRVQLKD